MRKSLAELNDELKDGEKKDVVVVTHGVFMKFLSGDPEIDLPKAGWMSYIVGRDNGGGIVLVLVEGTAGMES